MVHFCASLLLPRFRGNMSAKPRKKGAERVVRDKKEPMLERVTTLLGEYTSSCPLTPHILPLLILYVCIQLYLNNWPPDNLWIKRANVLCVLRLTQEIESVLKHQHTFVRNVCRKISSYYAYCVSNITDSENSIWRVMERRFRYNQLL